MENLSCTCISRIKIVKMAILSKAVYRLSAKTVLYTKETSRGTTIPEFKFYYNAKVIKRAWY